MPARQRLHPRDEFARIARDRDREIRAVLIAVQGGAFRLAGNEQDDRTAPARANRLALRNVARVHKNRGAVRAREQTHGFIRIRRGRERTKAAGDDVSQRLHERIVVRDEQVIQWHPIGNIVNTFSGFVLRHHLRLYQTRTALTSSPGLQVDYGKAYSARTICARASVVLEYFCVGE